MANLALVNNEDHQDIRIITDRSAEYGDNVIVFHNGVALTDEITNQNITVEGALASIGIFIEYVDFVSQLENA